MNNAKHIRVMYHHLPDTVVSKAIYRCVLSILLFVGLPNIGLAQQGLEINEIEVIKHFDARLIEAQKITFIPRLPEADTTARQYQYSISVTNPKISYLPPQIRPLALRPEEQPKGYRGILRAGFGIPHAILGDLFYQLINSDPFQLSISGHHYSANNKKRDLHKFSETGGNIKGTYLVAPALMVSGDLGYNHNPVYFYGLDPEDTTPYVDERRIYKTFTLRGGISNAELLQGGINYKATLDYYNHQDDLSAKEDGMCIRLLGEKWFGDYMRSMTKGGQHVLSLDMNIDLSTLEDAEQKRSLDNFVIHPSYAYRNTTWSASGGVNVSIHQEEVLFFPTLDVSVQIAGSRLIVFAQIDGGLAKNTFRSLSTYNPFIHQQIEELRNTEHRDYAAGVKGSLGKLEYLAKGSYSTVNNLTLFEPDAFDYRKFQPLYDDGNLICVEGELRAEPVQRLNIGAALSKTFYDLDIQEKPWHLPGLQASVFATYLTEDKKLQFRSGLFYENGVPYVTDDGDVDRLKALFDLSVGADYYFTEHIGAFVQVNNLFGNKHERWERYPVFGVNGVAGVLLRI